jgi:hypothetical protein
MAAYEHLLIFKKMMDLAVLVEGMAMRFSRYHRYTLGTELRGLCHEALATIADANQHREKGPVLLKLRLVLERIKIHLVLAREVRAYPTRESFGRAAELAVEVSRQNEGWLKSASKRG